MARRRHASKKAADAQTDGDAKPQKAGETLWEQIWTLGLAILIALGVRHFLIEPFRIPSGSMFPTLLIGDHLFVNKFVYGAKIPFTDYRLPDIREPRRGDVVVFTVGKQGMQTFPADRRPELPREEFVKRIVGLPGDEIDVRRNVMYVNGQPVQATPLDEPWVDPGGSVLEASEVTFENGPFQILDDPQSLGPPASWPVKVEPGRYFMMGDNRDNSKDSRDWGTVRFAEFRGPAFILYFSWDFNGSWGEVLNPMTWWNAEKRWDRVGQFVR
jgi:signal peptidase I